MLSSIYNYLKGYVKVNCSNSNCNREIVMYNRDIIPGVEISCSHTCTFELYNRINKK